MRCTLGSFGRVSFGSLLVYAACSAPAQAQTLSAVAYAPSPEPGAPLLTTQVERIDTPPPERAAILNVPVSLETARIGNVRAEITATRVLRISPTELAEVLGASINDATREKLSALGTDLVAVARLQEIGLLIALDRATLSLTVEVPLALRGTQVLTGSREASFAGLTVAEPTDVAAGATFTSFTTGDITRGENINSLLNFRGFANVGGIEGVNFLYGGDFNIAGEGKFFRRDRLLLFKDDPERVLRYSAGDILPLQSRFSSNFDMLGIGVQRFYQDIQPNRNVRPLGNRSFLLERPALVEIYVNGALIRSFNAAAGPIDIRDIPAAELSNQVTIVVEDALGRREIDSFTLGNDINLLAKGLSEFSFNIGVLRDSQLGGFSYTSDPVASLFYVRGVSETVTLGGSAVITEDYQNAALVGALAGFGGVTQIDFTASSSRVGEGAAVSIAYRGTPVDLGYGPAQTNFRAEYRTSNFQTLASFGFVEDIKFDLAVDVRANVAPSLQAIVGATYLTRHRLDEERYGIFAGLQKQFGLLNIGATARHTRFNDRNEFGVLVTASMVLGRRSNIFATADTATGRGRVEFRQLRPLTLPEIEFGARAEYGPDRYEVGGRFGYGTSRFEALIDIQQEYDRDTSSFRNQSSMRLQTGVAYSDGTFGIGRDPSLGFVMVKKHPSLGDAQVRVSTGSVGRDLGFANALGPAVVPVFIPYRPQEIRVATEGAPVGYNIGAGEYAAISGARSGIPITVGSDDYRIAIANLVTFDGEQIGLVTGQLIEIETGKKRSFFTNRTGRAVFTQLRPGKYRLIVDESGLEFDFEVRSDDPANIRLGEIKLRSDG